MDNQLCQFITNEITDLVMRENAKLMQENEDLLKTNEILLEDTKKCSMLEARVRTLEREFDRYYEQCMELSRINDILLSGDYLHPDCHSLSTLPSQPLTLQSPSHSDSPSPSVPSVTNKSLKVNLSALGVPCPQGCSN